jgi:hypothetical protein
VWAFEGGDWRQLPDLPLGAGGGDVQLLFDRGRNVLVAFVLGELFDLRDDTWVAVDVDGQPRADALAVYDETSQRVLFVGGLNFEFPVTTIDAYDLANTRAGAVARFDLRATGASNGAAHRGGIKPRSPAHRTKRCGTGRRVARHPRRRCALRSNNGWCATSAAAP